MFMLWWLNPFWLEGKAGDQNKPEIIYMLWKECMSGEFCKHACLEENFVYLNGENLLYTKLSELVQNFIKNDDKTPTGYETSCLNLKTFSSAFTPVCTLRSTVQLNDEVLT